MKKRITNKTKELEKLIPKLINHLSAPLINKLNNALSIKEDNKRRQNLLNFLTEIYPQAKKSTVSIIKDCYISLADTTQRAEEVTEKILPYLNHPVQFKRIAALEIIYHLYNEKFIPSEELSRRLSIHITDCLSISAEISPELDLSKGYTILKNLGNKYPDEIFPLLYDALKNPSHPCRLKFMELLGDVKFEGFLWVERLTPYIMDFMASNEENLILIATKAIKKLFPGFPYLFGRFTKPLLNLLETGTEKVQESISDVVLVMSVYHRQLLLDVITILIDYVKDKKKSQKATIIIGKALDNLMKLNEGKIKNTIKIISPSKKIKDPDGDKEKIWNNISVKVLEDAMITQQIFTIKEFLWLFGTDVFKETLAKLVLNLHGERGSFLGIYHEKNWLTAEGRLRFAHTDQIFTIAHPLDIFFANQITIWQKNIMEKKIKQPFQQVFRSLYSLHMDEIAEIESLRFSNQQLITEKVKKTFFEEEFLLKDNYAYYNWKDSHIQSRFIWDRKNTAHKGIAITGQIQFYKILDLKTDHIDDKRIPLWQIDPRIFSETIRKLELVISEGIFRRSFY